MPATKKAAPRKRDRRVKLTEAQFRRLVEAGKLSEGDRRAWVERRAK